MLRLCGTLPAGRRTLFRGKARHAINRAGPLDALFSNRIVAAVTCPKDGV
jgi:hypothetical protein